MSTENDVEAQNREPIRGSVAQILNSRELVINRGQRHGVELGMRFAILNSRGSDITDPETGESLGPIEIEKTTMKVVRVHDRAAVARTFRTFYTRATGLSVNPLASVMGEPARKIVETIETTEDTYQEELSEENSFIKRGDPVVEVRGEEFLND